jgi:hypothetical protein
VAGDEVVERDHVEAIGQQAIHEVGADEAGAAGDQRGFASEIMIEIHAMENGGGSDTLPPVVGCPGPGQNQRRERREVSSGRHQGRRLDGVMDRKFRCLFNKK